MTDFHGRVGHVYFPVFTTDPNAGSTFGFMPIWLITEHSRIKQIIAPMVTYNKTFGPGFSGTYYYYPTERSQARGLPERSAKSDYRAAGDIESRDVFDGRCILKADLNYEADGTPRFFGIGPASPASGEASYRMIEKLAHTEVGIKYLKSWRDGS